MARLGDRFTYRLTRSLRFTRGLLSKGRSYKEWQRKSRSCIECGSTNGCSSSFSAYCRTETKPRGNCRVTTTQEKKRIHSPFLRLRSLRFEFFAAVLNASSSNSELSLTRTTKMWWLYWLEFGTHEVRSIYMHDFTNTTEYSWSRGLTRIN